jgi:hypothetical protein
MITIIDPITGAKRKICEKCYEKRIKAKQEVFPRRSEDRDDPSTIFLIPPMSEQFPIHPGNIEPPAFEGKGGEFGGAGASGSWDPAPPSDPEPNSSPPTDSPSDSGGSFDSGGSSDCGGGGSPD